jgi:hypothetical protein
VRTALAKEKSGLPKPGALAIIAVPVRPGRARRVAEGPRQAKSPTLSGTGGTIACRSHFRNTGMISDLQKKDGCGFMLQSL